MYKMSDSTVRHDTTSPYESLTPIGNRDVIKKNKTAHKTSRHNNINPQGTVDPEMSSNEELDAHTAAVVGTFTNVSASVENVEIARDRYLTIAPKGLESFVQHHIRQTLDSEGYFCEVGELGCATFATSCNTDISQGVTLDYIATRVQQSKAKRMAKKRSKQKKKEQNLMNEHCNPESIDLSRVAGTIYCKEIGSMASVGYHLSFDGVRKIGATPGMTEGISLISFSTNAPPRFVASMSGMGCGPLLAMITSSQSEQILRFDQKMQESLASIRAMTEGCDNYFEHFHSAIRLWNRHANEVWFAADSIYGLDESSSPYKRDVKTESDRPVKMSNILRQKIAYRLSCLRSQSKKFAYKRETMLPYLDDLVIPWRCLDSIQSSTTTIKSEDIESSNITNNKNNEKKRKMGTLYEGKEQMNRNQAPALVVTQSNESTNSLQHGQQIHNRNSNWHVDLKNYDVEILTIIHNCCVTVAIPLRPYQHWGTKSYSSNQIPMDGTGGGWFASPGARLKVNKSSCEHQGSAKMFNFPDGFLRLRPSTAGKMRSDLAIHKPTQFSNILHLNSF